MPWHSSRKLTGLQQREETDVRNARVSGTAGAHGGGRGQQRQRPTQKRSGRLRAASPGSRRTARWYGRPCVAGPRGPGHGRGGRSTGLPAERAQRTCRKFGATCRGTCHDALQPTAVETREPRTRAEPDGFAKPRGRRAARRPGGRQPCRGNAWLGSLTASAACVIVESNPPSPVP